jgi:hypothetical protein
MIVDPGTARADQPRTEVTTGTVDVSTTVTVPGASPQSATVTTETTTTMHSSPYHVPCDARCSGSSSTEATPAPPSHAGRTVPRFSNHPYEDRDVGRVERRPAQTGAQARMFAGHGWVEAGFAGRKGVRFDHGVQISYWRVALDANVGLTARRDVDNAADPVMFRGTDLYNTMNASSNLMIAPVMRPRIIWYVGGGGRSISDMETDDNGRHRLHLATNFTTRADIFPVFPLVVSARMDYARFGDAPYVKARTTAGVMGNRAEFYAGYQIEVINAHPFHGPQFGMRLWF